MQSQVRLGVFFQKSPKAAECHSVNESMNKEFKQNKKLNMLNIHI